MAKASIISITQYDPNTALAAFAAGELAVGNVVVINGDGKWALGANDGSDMAKLTLPLLIGCTAAEAIAGGQPAYLTAITNGKGKLSLSDPETPLTVGAKLYPVSDGVADTGEVTDDITETAYANGDMAVVGYVLPNNGILIRPSIDWMEDIGA